MLVDGPFCTPFVLQDSTPLSICLLNIMWGDNFSLKWRVDRGDDGRHGTGTIDEIDSNALKSDYAP
jgi:hypothetical protein